MPARIRFVLSLLCALSCRPVAAAEPKPAADAEPVVVGTFPENEADIVQLPNGTLKIFYNQRGEFVGSLTSHDKGLTWSAPQKEFVVAGETAHAIQVLLDRRGELQVFYLIIRRGGRKLGVDYFLDLWQATTTGGGMKWNEPKLAHAGAIGALRGIVQTRSGRIVIPFSTAHPERKAGPPIGYFYTTAVYSDDDGATWQESKSQLTAPCTEGYNGGNYGAVEPTIVQLKDDRLWMLIRTQTGRMYESFSTDDGTTWSEAKPSQFYGSNSPAMFRRLNDGRLLVVWNNAQVCPKHEGQGVYSGRDALHAAISKDDGEHFSGYREIYRDPTRHGAGPELRNDRGTAYPDAVQIDDGTIVVVTGQGEGRRAILRFRPEFLLATHREDDFSHGLEQWHGQQETGPAQRFFRARREGAQIVPHPDDPKRQVLSVGRRDAEPGAGALWNFRQSSYGTITLRVRIDKNFRGAELALNDRLFNPTDDAALSGWFHSKIEAYRLTPRKPGNTIQLVPERWYDLQLKWDLFAANQHENCQVFIDGLPHYVVLLSRLPDPSVGSSAWGVSYLIVRSTADKTDPQGLLVERVSVDSAGEELVDAPQPKDNK